MKYSQMNIIVNPSKNTKRKQNDLGRIRTDNPQEILTIIHTVFGT